jgi:hypothetical protein
LRETFYFERWNTNINIYIIYVLSIYLFTEGYKIANPYHDTFKERKNVWVTQH